MKNSHYRLLIIPVLLVTLVCAGCNVFNIEDRPDPNNSELNGVISNPSRADINTLATGTESSLRTDLRIYHINLGMIGREMYRFLAAEPRNTQDLLGGGSSILDPGSFYTSRPWAAFYTSIRNANILIQSASSIEGGTLSDAEKEGVLGYANTLKAYSYLQALDMMNENGIRQQNPTNPQETGPLLSKQEGFNLIISLLDDAASSLSNAGDAFPFTLSSGFDGFSTPSGFLQFNRALRARVAVYTEDWNGALGFLNNSFIDATGDLKNGVYHVYSTDPNDVLNPVFANPQSGAGDSWVAHPSFVEDAEDGDNRVVGNKAILRVDDEGDPNPATLDGLTSSYGLFVYKSQTAPFPIIRNAELLLIRAEANINSSTPNFAAAVNDLNVIRDEAGLPPYTGPLTQEALNDEMLKQRRYELFFEGHRWVDMRRFDRLDELPLDREGDNVWVSFPLPESENI
ncbi:MAG: RagB/SusD family nutrient uptake outer membrane protein [Balneolaceae bacterium]|nr:RagB/SusD family nutrient uptake outer membrane protein [Balneolaceae bacterium]